MTPPQMAAQGRNGDSVVAHLTPGEIEIPPQVQTPQLIAAIRQAFAHFGISPAQFTAGSPNASHNPATGAPEFNFLSSILPMIAAGGASIAAPALAPAALSGALGSALVPAAAGLGAAAGTAATGGNASQSLLSGVGAAGGSALLGGLNPATSGTFSATPASSALSGGNLPSVQSALSAGGSTGNMNAGMINGPANPFSGAAGATAAPGIASGAPTSNAMPGLFGRLGGTLGSASPAIGAGLGAAIGGSLAPATQKSILPPGFNNNLPALNTNFGQLNGSNVQSTPSFQNYNPYQAVSGPTPGYNFYPQT
jgi:hypothetical protein